MNLEGFIRNTLFNLPGIIIGLSFHEFAHAFVADKLGDPTPRNQGRLTLYPGVHLDFLGFVSLILAGFGWAKPVQINPKFYKHPRRDTALVSIAGIIMNIIVAMLMGLVLRLTTYFNLANLLGSVTALNLIQILVYILQINVLLAVFNLIPIPPLDGFNIVASLFNLRKGETVQKLYRHGILILILLLATGIISYIVLPPAQIIIQLIVRVIANL